MPRARLLDPDGTRPARLLAPDGARAHATTRSNCSVQRDNCGEAAPHENRRQVGATAASRSCSRPRSTTAQRGIRARPARGSPPPDGTRDHAPHATSGSIVHVGDGRGRGRRSRSRGEKQRAAARRIANASSARRMREPDASCEWLLDPAGKARAESGQRLRASKPRLMVCSASSVPGALQSGAPQSIAAAECSEPDSGCVVIRSNNIGKTLGDQGRRPETVFGTAGRPKYESATPRSCGLPLDCRSDRNQFDGTSAADAARGTPEQQFPANRLSQRHYFHPKKRPASPWNRQKPSIV